MINYLFNFFKKSLQIYTDGSQKAKWGSWAFVVVKNNKVIHEASARVSKTNSNRMEFQAAIEALAYLKSGEKACIYTDSRILIKAMSSSENRPAANEDQIKILDQLVANRKINWKWVKAHSGNKYNERSDELCRAARAFK